MLPAGTRIALRPEDGSIRPVTGLGVFRIPAIWADTSMVRRRRRRASPMRARPVDMHMEPAATARDAATKAITVDTITARPPAPTERSATPGITGPQPGPMATITTNLPSRTTTAVLAIIAAVAVGVWRRVPRLGLQRVLLSAQRQAPAHTMPALPLVWPRPHLGRRPMLTYPQDARSGRSCGNIVAGRCGSLRLTERTGYITKS